MTNAVIEKTARQPFSMAYIIPFPGRHLGHAIFYFDVRGLLTAGAASQCYWDKLMLLKFELMLLKCQINTNTKKRFLHLTKYLERVLKYPYLVSIIWNYQFHKTMFANFFVWSWILIALAQILLALVHTLIELAYTLIALTHLNSTEKLHRLTQE